jgi:hypothetical protein
MNKTAKKHLDAIDSGMITKTNVIGIRKLLNSLWRQERRYSTSCTSPKASFADADEIVAVIHKMKPIVTGDLHESGLKLLRSKRHSKRLESVQSIINRIEKFQLIDFQEFKTGSSPLHYPIYRAIALNGDSFDFYNIPWQSGGNGPELLGSV